MRGGGAVQRVKQGKNQWIINPNSVEKYWNWHFCYKELEER